MKTLFVLFVTIFTLGFTNPNNDQKETTYEMVIPQVQYTEDGAVDYVFFYETIMIKSELTGDLSPASATDAQEHVIQVSDLDAKTLESFTKLDLFNLTIIEKNGKKTITAVAVL